jgi:hypothetical protein
VDFPGGPTAQESDLREFLEREESMTLSAHRFLFSLIVLAALVGFGWVLIIYVLSFHAAQWVIDKIDGGHAPRRGELRTARLHSAPVRPIRRA